MASKNSQKGGNKTGLAGRSIYIVGQQRFQNELLAFYLEKETGSKCIVGENPSNITGTVNKRSARSHLILIECPAKEHDAFLIELETEYGGVTAHHLVALFNVEQGQGIEEKAVTRGIKGIFYNQDPLGRFQKGIKAIFENELWVSREVLTKYVMENRGSDRASNQEETLLTSREIEILAMISAGAKNEDIADKLCISPNTVKTHIYNIFKKINVPNRLQAALWAAKNL
ncbi:LuxR C-terminal-related transcriptional regulator [Thermodesulfobacteriota bacterium]